MGGRSWPSFRHLSRCKLAVAIWSHSANFGLIALKRLEHGLRYWDSRFTSFQSDLTKIGGVTSNGNKWLQIFCNLSGFWPMTSLRAAITSKRRLSHPSRLYFLNPECVRIPWVAAPKVFPLKIFGYVVFHPKNSFFVNFRAHTLENVAGSCALNFGASDLPIASLKR